ncbi:MAG: TonB-dependent receptor [Rhodospirillaceae bacterium]|nr:TonB-dependent receptor [Rhodospirillaceae bacterium]
MKKFRAFALASVAPIAMMTAAATAQEQMADAVREVPQTAVEEVVVNGVVFRDRTETAAPVLSYDLEYFQRFEPVTAGDALKRVSSVQFLSDVSESDGARLRGLDSGYTQILINGEKVPGGGLDRSFFVDRIPAELIERVEVVRNSSANRSGDAVSGALNIVLRDGNSLEGGYVRAGGSRFRDGELRGTAGGVYGGEAGPGRILLGVNVQGRRNPKLKISERYDAPGGTLDNIETQADTRDGTDYSFNGSYIVPIGPGEFKVDGFFVRTDREEFEDSIEYIDGVLTSPNTDTRTLQTEDIQQDNYGVNARYKFPMLGGETSLKLGYAAFTDKTNNLEQEFEYRRDAVPFPDDDRYTGDSELNDLEDTEISAKLEHEHKFSDMLKAEAGLQFNQKDRDTNIVAVRNRFNIPNPPAARPTIPPTFTGYAPVPGGLSTIEERRIDPYIMFSGDAGPLKWEAGLRYETTDVEINDLTAPAATQRTNTDYNTLLPSAHIRWSLTEQDRISISGSRTVRRPNFNDMSPAVLLAEKGENDFVGNPLLRPEKAWGFDVGYEHYLGRKGVVGLNFFYRDISDVIEDVNTGVVGSEGAGTFVLSSANTGSGEVYGVEFDLSTPLGVIGLPDTGIFVNASWLDSKLSDNFGSRRFNDQAKYVVNTGFIQDLPTWGAAFGVTYRKQGAAYGRIVGEEVRTTYGSDLEAFIEKKITSNFVVRFTGSNLLNYRKKEVFNKFNTIGDQTTRSFDEYELESEKSGPVLQLVARYAF